MEAGEAIVLSHSLCLQIAQQQQRRQVPRIAVRRTLCVSIIHPVRTLIFKVCWLGSDICSRRPIKNAYSCWLPHLFQSTHKAVHQVGKQIRVLQHLQYPPDLYCPNLSGLVGKAFNQSSTLSIGNSNNEYMAKFIVLQYNACVCGHVFDNLEGVRCGTPASVLVLKVALSSARMRMEENCSGASSSSRFLLTNSPSTCNQHDPPDNIHCCKI